MHPSQKFLYTVTNISPKESDTPFLYKKYPKEQNTYEYLKQRDNKHKLYKGQLKKNYMSYKWKENNFAPELEVNIDKMTIIP